MKSLVKTSGWIASLTASVPPIDIEIPRGPQSDFHGVDAERITDINKRAVEKCHHTETLLQTEINRLVAALADTQRVRASHEAALKVLEGK